VVLHEAEEMATTADAETMAVQISSTEINKSITILLILKLSRNRITTVSKMMVHNRTALKSLTVKCRYAVILGRDFFL
jgi:hypothetical protein